MSLFDTLIKVIRLIFTSTDNNEFNDNTNSIKSDEHYYLNNNNDYQEDDGQDVFDYDQNIDKLRLRKLVYSLTDLKPVLI